jgi:actin
VYLASSPVLTLYSSARTTGTVLQSGGGVTNVASIYEGHLIQDSCFRMGMCGKDIDEYLEKEFKNNGQYDIISGKKQAMTSAVGCESTQTSALPQVVLDEANFCFTSNAGILRNMKETLGYVSLDYSEELLRPLGDVERKYELPDGQSVTIGQDRFKCGEIMFQPSLIGKNEDGIHQVIDMSIRKCDEELRADLYNTIVIGGGNCSFPEFTTRLTKEVATIAPSSLKVRVVTPAYMKYSAWVGGSILSKIPTFNNNWISKDQYDEFGPTIVHRMCF